MGRPRNFDEAETLDQAVDAFWRLGIHRSTTRTLETELGLTQSSIYNAFGSKAALTTKVIDRYLEQLEVGVVCHIDHASAGFRELEIFLVELVEWISNSDRPGCLLLNLSAEQGIADDELVARSRFYRLHLRELFTQLLVNEGVANPSASANLILASVMGLNVAARAGADRAEIDLLVTGLRDHVAWLAAAVG